MSFALEFAQAVAESPKALKINPDNTNGGWTTIPRALDQGVPFAVRVKPNILAVDFDQNEDGLIIAGGAAQALEAEGLFPIVERSGQHNRAHLWAVIDDPDLMARAERYCKQLGGDIRKGHNLMRPPSSRHRAGGHATIVYPGTPELALARLKRGAIPTPNHAIQGLQRMLSEAPKAGSGKSSDHIFGMATYALDHGVPFADWAEIAEQHPKVVTNRGKAGQLEYIRKTWESAVRKHRPKQRSNNSRAWVEATQSAKLPIGLRDIVWKIQAVATLTQRDRVYLSVRALAENLGCDKATVSRKLHRLQRLGWIRSLPRQNAIHATEFQLTIPQTYENATQVTSPPPTGEVLQNFTFLDAFARKGVSKQVYMAIAQGEALTVADIARRLDLSPSAVRHHVRWLEEQGLVKRGRNRLVFAVVDPDFVTVAERRKTYGKAKLREFMHRGQRESFRKEVEQLEAQGKRFDPQLSYRKRSNRLERVQPQRLAQPQTLTMTKAFAEGGVPMLGSAVGGG